MKKLFLTIIAISSLATLNLLGMGRRWIDNEIQENLKELLKPQFWTDTIETISVMPGYSKRAFTQYDMTLLQLLHAKNEGRLTDISSEITEALKEKRDAALEMAVENGFSREELEHRLDSYRE